MPHGDPVVDGDGIELGGKATQGFHFRLDDLPYPVQMHVPGDELGKRIGDRDDRTPHLFLFHAVGSPQRACPGHAAGIHRLCAAKRVFHFFFFHDGIFCFHAK